MIKSLEAKLKNMKVPKEGISFPGDHIFKIFSDACMTEYLPSISRFAILVTNTKRVISVKIGRS